MKAKIISTVLAGMFFVGTVGSAFAVNPRIYKKTEKSDVDNTVATEVYRGEDDANLVPLAKYVVKYSDEGKAVEKTIYKWNVKEGWTAQLKYVYHYDLSGKMDALEYAEWDVDKKHWKDNPYLTMYLYTGEGDLLTINE